jgi:hypothetical protein
MPEGQALPFGGLSRKRAGMIDLGGNTQTDEQDSMVGEPAVPLRARSSWKRRALVSAGGVSAVLVLALGAGWIWRDAIAKS